MALNPQLFAQLLSGLGASLAAKGSGSPQWGFAGAQAMQNTGQMQDQARRAAMQDEIQRAQLLRQQQADAEAQAAKSAAAKSWRGLIGQPDPNATPKFVGGAGSSPASFQQPTAPAADPMFGSLPPQLQGYIKSRGEYDPAGAMDVFGELAMKTLEPPKLPAKEEFFNQDGTAYQGYRKPDGTVIRIGPNYPRWAPSAPREAKVKLRDLTPDEIKARGLPIGTVAQLNPETNELDIKSKGAEGPGGMFDTKSIPGQALNFLAAHQQDPSSLEYAIAYAVASKPSVSYLPDGTVNSYTPDVSMFKKSAFAGPQAQVDAAAAAATGTAPTQPGAAPTAQPAPQSAINPNTQTQQIPGGGSVSRTPGGYQTPADIQKMKDIKSEVGSIKSSLETFRNVVKSSKLPDWADAASGGHFAGGKSLNSAWANAALQTKAEALYNLGVLNGPDLPLIQRVLTDPSTVGGAFSSVGAYEAGIDQVLNLIDARVAAFESQYGPKNPQAPAPDPAAPATDPSGMSDDDLKKALGL